MTPDEKKVYMKEYNKRYREANREKLLQQSKEHYKMNKKVHTESVKKYYKKNKEIIEAKKRKWESNNKDKVSAGQKRYRLKLILSNEKLSVRTLNAWATQIKNRDEEACVYCGSKRNLNAHHILSKAKHPELALLINNGITLCWNCHVEEHKINGDM
jgi:5-methylcytosine-specific restriction endonuclease McrA